MFTDKERRIFSYCDGVKTVWADPVKVRRDLNHALDGDVNKVIAKTRSELEPEAYDAVVKLLNGIRYAFGMVPFDPATGDGATDEDCLDALAAFVDFECKKKVSGETLPTCSPALGLPTDPA